MAHQIVKQPNGKYAVWSTVVDDFIYRNCTVEQLIKRESEDAIRLAKLSTKERVERAVKSIEINGTDSGGDTYEDLIRFQKESKENQDELAMSRGGTD